MQDEKKQELPQTEAEEEILLTNEGKLPVEEAPEDAPAEPEKEPYTPHSTGMRILALVLAVIVIIGLILWYYHLFTFK